MNKIHRKGFSPDNTLSLQYTELAHVCQMAGLVRGVFRGLCPHSADANFLRWHFCCFTNFFLMKIKIYVFINKKLQLLEESSRTLLGLCPPTPLGDFRSPDPIGALSHILNKPLGSVNIKHH